MVKVGPLDIKKANFIAVTLTGNWVGASQITAVNVIDEKPLQAYLKSSERCRFVAILMPTPLAYESRKPGALLVCYTYRPWPNTVPLRKNS